MYYNTLNVTKYNLTKIYHIYDGFLNQTIFFYFINYKIKFPALLIPICGTLTIK